MGILFSAAEIPDKLNNQVDGRDMYRNNSQGSKLVPFAYVDGS
jgi:hypothetical protein